MSIQDTPSPSIKEAKKSIQLFNEQLIERSKGETPIEELLESRSDFIDRLLSSAWSDFLGAYSNELSLIATGGYGRAELHPFSDIDLLIIFDEEKLTQYQTNIESFSTFLWDIGLKPGLSVRTLKDCIEQ